MKRILIIFLAVFILMPGNAQLSVKKNQFSSYAKTKSPLGLSNAESDLFVDLFVDCLLFSAEMLIWANEFVMEKHGDSIPYLRSIDASITGGSSPGMNAISVPELYFQYGIFISQFRSCLSYESHFNESTFYGDIDAMFYVGFIVYPRINASIGTGFMLEPKNDDSYMENGVMLNLYPGNRFRIKSEARYAWEFSSGLYARKEINSSLYYLLTGKGMLLTSMFLNYRYVDYNASSAFSAFSVGLNLKLLY